MLNKCIFQGRLTKDPELRYTVQNNTPVCSFTIAVQNDVDKDKAVFVNCVAWQKTGEFISKYFKKGSSILVEGRMDQRSYTDKDGKPRTAYEIVTERVFFCGSKSDTSGKPPVGDPVDVEYEEMTEQDGDLPF